MKEDNRNDYNIMSLSLPSLSPSLFYDDNSDNNNNNMLLPLNKLSSLSDAQSAALALVPIIPSILSIFGSCMVIYLVYYNHVRSTPYRRIMLGISICDVLYSITIPLWPFLLPKYSSQHVWAFGNDTTCSISGAAYQFSFSSIFYNAMLSHYFLLAIKFGWRDRQISKHIEPIMHIISIGYPLITSIVGLILGVYHETKLLPTCWTANYPQGCGNNDINETGEKCWATLLGWIFGGIPISFLLLSLVINNIIIYIHVRKTIRRQQYRYEFSHYFSSSNNNDGLLHDNNNNNNHHCRRSHRHHHRHEQNSQTKRIQTVATQAFLYVTACIITNFFPILIRNMEDLNSFHKRFDSKVFILMLGYSIFAPLQGFFNLLIFIRPKYMAVRSSYPNESKWQSICNVLLHHNNNNINNKKKNKPKNNEKKNNDNDKNRQDCHFRQKQLPCCPRSGHRQTIHQQQEQQEQQQPGMGSHSSATSQSSQMMMVMTDDSFMFITEKKLENNNTVANHNNTTMQLSSTNFASGVMIMPSLSSSSSSSSLSSPLPNANDNDTLDNKDHAIDGAIPKEERIVLFDDDNDKSAIYTSTFSSYEEGTIVRA